MPPRYAMRFESQTPKSAKGFIVVTNLRRCSHVPTDCVSPLPLQKSGPPTEPRSPETLKVHFKVRKMPFPWWTFRIFFIFSARGRGRGSPGRQRGGGGGRYMREIGTMWQIGVLAGKPCTFLGLKWMIFGVLALQK